MTDRATARVFLVDDHPLVRESLASLIDRQPGLSVCGEAADATTALSAIGQSPPDVVVVDLSLGGRPGLELVHDLKRMHPGVAVLVLSMHDENLYAERVLRAGARGYIMKREATGNVIDAIRCVLEGRIYLSPRMATALAAKLVSGATEPTETAVTRLSDRELEVFRLLGQGLATRQIADAMQVSAKTVQAFAARIKEKLGLASATELLREAIRWNEEQGGR